jgi:hypothetical protein
MFESEPDTRLGKLQHAKRHGRNRWSTKQAWMSIETNRVWMGVVIPGLLENILQQSGLRAFGSAGLVLIGVMSKLMVILMECSPEDSRSYIITHYRAMTTGEVACCRPIQPIIENNFVYLQLARL